MSLKYSRQTKKTAGYSILLLAMVLVFRASIESAFAESFEHTSDHVQQFCATVSRADTADNNSNGLTKCALDAYQNCIDSDNFDACSETLLLKFKELNESIVAAEEEQADLLNTIKSGYSQKLQICEEEFSDELLLQCQLTVELYYMADLEQFIEQSAR